MRPALESQQNSVITRNPGCHEDCTMKKITYTCIWLIAVIAIGGCAHYVTPSKSTYLGSERIFSKNYELGQKQIAYVGQPVVKVKDYVAIKKSSLLMRPTHDFVLSAGKLEVSGRKDATYKIRGESKIEDRTLKVVNIPGHPLAHLRPGEGFGLFIREDGTVDGRALNNTTMSVLTYSPEPPDLRFLPVQEEEIDITAGYINYELIYGGTDGRSITITYREYTSDNVARPAFYQNLVYDVNQKQIRFRNLQILVHNASNEKISYTVLSDSTS